MVWKEENYVSAEGNMPRQLHSSYLTAQEMEDLQVVDYFRLS
jgi:hypothetical protein